MFQIQLDRESDVPLYVQIRDFILQSIENKELLEGSRLPTVTEVAGELKISRATVLHAYEDLTKSGHIASHVGRGTFVTTPPVPTKTNSTESSATQSPLAPADHEFAMAARRLRMGIDKTLEVFQIIAQRPGLMQFISGVPDPTLTAPGILDKLTYEALKRGQKIYQSYSPPAGLPELRQTIAEWLTTPALKILPEQVLITSGSQQAVSILAQVALENAQRVICEVPCYKGIPKAFGAIGHWVETVVRDDDGPLIERLANPPGKRKAMLYLCPQLHNPMGMDIGDETRKKLITWAQAENNLIIADEIFRDLYFTGKPPLSLIADGGVNHVIVIGSLSKSFMCGLRIGWIVSSEERIRSFTELKRAMDIGCPPLMQGIAVELLRSGEYQKHLQRARKHYKLRCDQVLETLKTYMPQGVTWTYPTGGFHLWCRLPKGYSSFALFLLAIERGVGIMPGPCFDVDHRFMNAFHIGYGSLEPDQIQRGITLLADAVKELFKHPPGDPGLSGLGDFS